MRRLLVILLSLSLLAPPPAAAESAENPIRRGYDLFYRGDVMAAYHQFTSLLESDPDNLAAGYGTLSAVFARHRMEDTLEEEFERRTGELIERAEARYDENKDDQQALFFLAQTYGLRAGFYFSKRERLFRSARDAARSKKYSEEYVKRNPRHADAYIALGLYNYYADLAPALLKFVRFLLLIPGGDRELGLSQVQRAAREATLWAPQAQMELVRMYTWTESRVEEGLELAADLERRFPGNAELALRLARLAAGPVLEDPGRAAKIYTRMMNRWLPGASSYADAVHVNAVLGLAEARAQLWELEEAKALVTSLIDKNPAQPSWAMPRLLFARAKYRSLLNDPLADTDIRRVRSNSDWSRWKTEAKAWQRWLEKRRASGEAARFVQLIPGNRLAAAGRYSEARAFYAKLLKASPSDLQVRYRLARLEFLQGRHREARAAFFVLHRKAKGYAPAWLKARTLLHLARLHDISGERKIATGYYEKLVDDYEETPEGLAARIGLLNPYRPSQLARR